MRSLKINENKRKLNEDIHVDIKSSGHTRKEVSKALSLIAKDIESGKNSGAGYADLSSNESSKVLKEEMSIYQKLNKAGAELDHHESDLYVKITPEVKKIIDSYKFKSNVSTFKSENDGALWYDVPFAYDPYWDKNGMKEAADEEGNYNHLINTYRAVSNELSVGEKTGIISKEGTGMKRIIARVLEGENPRDIFLKEKWAPDVEVEPTGEHGDKTVAQLKKEISDIKKGMEPGEKRRKELAQRYFAIRAKTGWGES